MSSCGHVSHQPLLRGRSSLKELVVESDCCFLAGASSTTVAEKLCVPSSLCGHQHILQGGSVVMGLGATDGTGWNTAVPPSCWQNVEGLNGDRAAGERTVEQASSLPPLHWSKGREGKQTLILLLLTLASLLGNI